MQKKGNIIATIVIGVLFLIGAVVCVILWATLNSDANMLCLLIGIILAVTGIIILFAGINQIKVSKKIAENMSNPSSICYKTYGNGGNYTYFLAYPDRKGQASRNAAANVAGALSFVFLGVGVFSYGSETCDVFVSSDELIINNKKKNPKLLDENFQCIPATAVLDIQFKTEKKYQRVYLSFLGGDKMLLDISLKNYSAELIVSNFSKLRDTQIAAMHQQENEGQPLVPAEEIFDV